MSKKYNLDLVLSSLQARSSLSDETGDDLVVLINALFKLKFADPEIHNAIFDKIRVCLSIDRISMTDLAQTLIAWEQARRQPRGWLDWWCKLRGGKSLNTKVRRSEAEALDNQLLQLYLKKTGVADYLLDIQHQYGIKIVLLDQTTVSWNARLAVASVPLERYLAVVQVLSRLLARYPVEFIKKINLATIVVGHAVHRVEEDRHETDLGGFASLSDDNVYLSDENIEGAFDHELYHQAMDYYDDFQAWQKLRAGQDLSFTYAQNWRPAPGFARNYGKENVAEDQATVAEEMMNNYANLMKRCESDELLAAKVSLVKKAYRELSEGKMFREE